MTEPSPSPAAASTSATSEAWSRCTATGTAAPRARARHAAATGVSPRWYATQFSLIWSTTGKAAASAPATIASACSMPITLNAPTPDPASRAGPMMSSMAASGISGSLGLG